jgi:hypothetical protein
MSKEPHKKEMLQDASPAEPSDKNVNTKDDMYDGSWEMEGGSLLAQALQVLQKEVSGQYWTRDSKAIRLQKEHRWITRVALFFGTGAVSLAILQLPLSRLNWVFLNKVLPWIEFFCAVLAAISVGYGLYLAIQKHWLLERHKAERLRFLKYRSILNLATDGELHSNMKKWAQEVKSQAREICEIEEDELKLWWEESPTSSDVEAEPVASRAEFEEIIKYYKKKRLEQQVLYLFKKTEKARASDSFTKYFPPALFLASIACAVSHLLLSTFVAPWLERHGIGTEWEKPTSIVLITLAALLPALGAAVRTHRSANEFSRNTVRFNAAHMALKDNLTILNAQVEPGAKLRALLRSEAVLENEHRDWLRLMDEAEWFG